MRFLFRATTTYSPAVNKCLEKGLDFFINGRSVVVRIVSCLAIPILYGPELARAIRWSPASLKLGDLFFSGRPF
jgi:hypothetical protein